MAKRKVNKSAKIREALNEMGADAKPKAVMAELASRRIKVTAAQVSNIKASLRGKASGSKNGLTVDSLLKAKALADKLGGVERARKVLDVLAELRI